MSSAEECDRLGASRFISLTTYKRDGTAVPTPVWVVKDGSHLLVWTAKTSGKAKRLRHTARVTVTASSARGTPRGRAVPGTARGSCRTPSSSGSSGRSRRSIGSAGRPCASWTGSSARCTGSRASRSAWRSH